MSRTLRAFAVDIGEQVWEQRVVARLALAHDNYLRPMHNNLHEQFNARYSLQAGKTWETHSGKPQESRILKALTQKLGAAHAILSNDRLHGPMRPTSRQHCARLIGGYHAPCSSVRHGGGCYGIVCPGSLGLPKRTTPKLFILANLVDSWPVRVCYKTYYYQGSCAKCLIARQPGMK